MSLDVSLVRPYPKSHDEGETWKEGVEEVFTSNMTHNLNTMADKAGMYEALWRPEKIDAVYAKDIVHILEKGITDMKNRPEYYKQWNSSNGWGMYKHFISFLENYLQACKDNPKLKIEISR